jgi:hypothetical protein
MIMGVAMSEFDTQGGSIKGLAHFLSEPGSSGDRDGWQPVGYCRLVLCFVTLAQRPQRREHAFL